MAELKGIELLKSKIRPVTDEDRKKLSRFSYSRLEQFKNCPYAYYLKYEKGNYPPSDSIALRLGTALHYQLEMKAKYKMAGLPVDYEALGEIRVIGCDSGGDHIMGTKELTKVYFDDWYKVNEKSGLNYPDKIKNFIGFLKCDMEDEWQPIAAEYEFEFVYDDRIILHGFIDSIRKNDKGQIQIVDFKSSNQTYGEDKTRTALQMAVYGMAYLNEFGILPDDYEYKFIVLGETAKALTKGWEGRVVKALDKILDSIDEMKRTEQFKCCASPLCHWCNFSATCPDATAPYKSMCDYYSLWTPTNKTFEVHTKQDFSKPIQEQPKRKLIF